MNISTRLRLLSTKNTLRGNVAQILLNNVDSTDNVEIVRYMKDIANNGCAYVMVKGMVYHNEIQNFYNRHIEEIDRMVWMYECNKENTKIEIVSNAKVSHAWWAFEMTVKTLMDIFHIR